MSGRSAQGAKDVLEEICRAGAGRKDHPVNPDFVTLRRQRVLLDRDLAAIYGVSTGRLNEAVKRNVCAISRGFHVPAHEALWLQNGPYLALLKKFSSDEPADQIGRAHV